MKGALRHPLVARLLGIVTAVVSARAGIGPVPGLMASQLRVDSFWRPGYSRPAAGRSNGSAKVRRAATKKRNQARNRRAHRG